MYLLDACTLLWWLVKDERLTPAVHACLANAANPVCVSVVSLWEILVKHRQGKIRIKSGDLTAYEFMTKAVRETGFEVIALQAADIRHISTLPALHRDPFDRMLICQAIERGMTLVTPDATIRRYPIRTLWH